MFPFSELFLGDRRFLPPNRLYINILDFYNY